MRIGREILCLPYAGFFCYIPQLQGGAGQNTCVIKTLHKSTLLQEFSLEGTHKIFFFLTLFMIVSNYIPQLQGGTN